MKTNSLTKKLFPFILVLGIVMSSCERSDINFNEPDIIKRLTEFLGEKETKVSRQMRKEGYRSIDFINSTDYIGGKDRYAISYNDDKTIYASAYTVNLAGKKEIQKKYDEWRILAKGNGMELYQGAISAKGFMDIDSGFIKVERLNDSTYAWVYDSEEKLQEIYRINKMGTTYLSELWYNGDSSVIVNGFRSEYFYEDDNDDDDLNNPGHVSLSIMDYRLLK